MLEAATSKKGVEYSTRKKARVSNFTFDLHVPNTFWLSSSFAVTRRKSTLNLGKHVF